MISLNEGYPLNVTYNHFETVAEQHETKQSKSECGYRWQVHTAGCMTPPAFQSVYYPVKSRVTGHSRHTIMFVCLKHCIVALNLGDNLLFDSTERSPLAFNGDGMADIEDAALRIYPCSPAINLAPPQPLSYSEPFFEFHSLAIDAITLSASEYTHEQC